MSKHKEALANIATRLSEIAGKLAKTRAEFEEFATADGPTLIIDGAPELDKDVRVRNEETGEETPAPDGEYKLADEERTIVVSGGKITEIKDAAPPAPAEPVQMEDIETVADAINKILDLLFQIEEMYRASNATLGAVLGAVETESKEVLVLQEQVREFGKMAPRSFTTRQPADLKTEAKFGAQAAKGTAQRILTSHLKKIAGKE